MFSDDNCAHVALSVAQKDPIPNLHVDGMSFAIFSADGTFHTPHWDPNGLSTVLRVVEGHKAIMLAVPSGDSLDKLVPHPTEDSLWTLAEQDHLARTIVVLGENDLM